MKRADGEGSHFFHDRIQAGDMLPVSAPRGNFTLAADDNPVVLLSAGIGATPVLSMLHCSRRLTPTARSGGAMVRATAGNIRLPRRLGGFLLIFPEAIRSLLIANPKTEISRAKITTHRAT